MEIKAKRWKSFRMAVASRKITLLKRLKLLFGIPKTVPSFRDSMIRIYDGKCKTGK